MRNHSVKELIATYGKLSAILGVNNLVIIGGLAIKFLCYGKRRVNDIDVTYTKRKTAKLFDTRKGVLAKSGFKVVRFGRSDKFRLIDKENAVGVDFSSRRWSGRYKKFTLATSKIKRVRLGNMTIKLNLASPEVLFLLKSVSLDMRDTLKEREKDADDLRVLRGRYGKGIAKLYLEVVHPSSQKPTL